MEVTGKCHCGLISYRSKVDPEKVSICHCTDCQILTGSPYRVSVPTAVQDFQLISGKIKAYLKTADSGSKRVMAFCPECGSPLYAENLESPKFRMLRVGHLAERAQLRPRRQIWCKSALPWAENIGGVAPKFDGQGN